MRRLLTVTSTRVRRRLGPPVPGPASPLTPGRPVRPGSRFPPVPRPLALPGPRPPALPRPSPAPLFGARPRLVGPTLLVTQL